MVLLSLSLLLLWNGWVGTQAFSMDVSWTRVKDADFGVVLIFS